MPAANREHASIMFIAATFHIRPAPPKESSPVAPADNPTETLKVTANSATTCDAAFDPRKQALRASAAERCYQWATDAALRLFGIDTSEPPAGNCAEALAGAAITACEDSAEETVSAGPPAIGRMGLLTMVFAAGAQVCAAAPTRNYYVAAHPGGTGGYAGDLRMFLDHFNIGYGTVDKVDVPQGAYMFARNVAVWNGSHMLLGDPDAYDRRPDFGQTTTAFIDYFREKHVPVTLLPYALNGANLDFKDGLLVVSHGENHEPGCATASHPAAGCSREVSQLLSHFKSARTVLQIEAASQVNGFRCYDLDLFFQVAINKDGKKVALVYTPCIAEKPTSPGALGRTAFLQKLKASGVTVIPIDLTDARDKRAANFVYLQPGDILLNELPSMPLVRSLRANGVDFILPPKGYSFGTHTPGSDVVGGAHCIIGDYGSPAPEPAQGAPKKAPKKKKEL
jgi:hypothetical protein